MISLTAQINITCQNKFPQVLMQYILPTHPTLLFNLNPFYLFISILCSFIIFDSNSNNPGIIVAVKINVHYLSSTKKNHRPGLTLWCTRLHLCILPCFITIFIRQLKIINKSCSFVVQHFRSSLLQWKARPSAWSRNCVKMHFKVQ